MSLSRLESSIANQIILLALFKVSIYYLRDYAKSLPLMRRLLDNL